MGSVCGWPSCPRLASPRVQVYKVMAPNRKIYALKRIRLTGRDREAAAGFIDEITLLQRLRGHSNIIQLIDAEVGLPMPPLGSSRAPAKAASCRAAACHSRASERPHSLAGDRVSTSRPTACSWQLRVATGILMQCTCHGSRCCLPLL